MLPSIVPADRLDLDIYLMLEDFGVRAGCAWREPGARRMRPPDRAGMVRSHAPAAAPASGFAYVPSGTFECGGAWEVMTSPSIVLLPGMVKPLRLLRIYGFMLERRDGLYHPGGNQPACTMALARMMAEGGWLVKHGERYELTEQGLRAAE